MADPAPREDAEFLQNKQEFANFLDPSDRPNAEYKKRVGDMVRQGRPRLVVDLNDLNKHSEGGKPAGFLRDKLLKHPMDCLAAWEEALRDFISHSEFGGKEMDQEYRIALQGGFGQHRLAPQEMRASSLGTMVCVEGIVSKASVVRPKLVKTVHYCEATQQFHEQTYRDATALNGMPTGATMLTQDQDGNPLTTEFGLSTYKDHQKVFVQDMPERTVAGTMPQTVECIVEADLVDACKPGDRVQIMGIYRALAGRATGQTSGRFRTVVLVNNVRKLGQEEKDQQVSADDAKAIRRVQREVARGRGRDQTDMFSLLARSIAPSLYGHDFIKKAILMQLVGGVEKNLANGTHIRGDINILMIGDPSCGKSQLLRSVLNIAPLAINTTGRGSSGVGLTAAVTQDKDTGERRLEAGAMVLADRGVVCIDEFDKMSDMDRTAIHEVMEQQTVTVAKAGIHTSLNARCSVIAAANPIYGMYDRRRLPHENIGLPDSLLSRFDLLFIVLDKMDTHIDRSIADHVLNMHLMPHQDEGDDIDDMDVDGEQNRKVRVWERNVPAMGGRGRARKFLTMEFCKKYINLAKSKQPKLTDEACEMVAQKYAELRDAERNQTLPITARCLETIIRLSTAHAKLRLDNRTVTEVDVEEAMKVLQFALTNDADPEQRSNRKANAGDDEDNDDGDDDDDEGDLEERAKEARAKRAARRRRRGRMSRPLEESDAEEKEEEKAEVEEQPPRNTPASRSRRKRTHPEPPEEASSNAPAKRLRMELDRGHVDFVSNKLSTVFRANRRDQIPVREFAESLQGGPSLTLEEVRNILQHLMDSNRGVFVEDDIIHQL